jgi:hypothetical protein
MVPESRQSIRQPKSQLMTEKTRMELAIQSATANVPWCVCLNHQLFLAPKIITSFHLLEKVSQLAQIFSAKYSYRKGDN